MDADAGHRPDILRGPAPPPWRPLAAVVLASTLMVPSASAGQANGAPGGPSNGQFIDQLTLTIDAGKPDECVGSGVIVGYDDRRTYAVTTASIVTEMTPGAAGGVKELDVSAYVPARDEPAGAGLEDVGWPTSGTARPAAPPGGGRRIRAQVLQLDPAASLALLGIEDAALLAAARTRLRFDVLGNAGSLVPRDPIYPAGCVGARLERGATRPLLQTVARTSSVAFQGADLRRPMTGGPLVHVLGSHATLIGINLALRDRALARNIDTVLERLRAWDVPVKLTAPATRAGCSYTYTVSRPSTPMSGRPVIVLGSGRDSVTVTVDTAAGCTWTTYADAAPWVRVTSIRHRTSDDNRGAPPGVQTGPGTVTVDTTLGNTCVPTMRWAAIHVAGHVIQVAQDGSNLGQGCPPQ